MVMMKLITTCLLCGLLLATPAASKQLTPEHPGILVIESARDSIHFNWNSVGGNSSVTWPKGAFLFSSSANVGTFGLSDLTIAYDRNLHGISNGRELVFQNGNYSFDAPLVLTASNFTLVACEGVLEIADGRINLKLPVDKKESSNSNYILLAGMIILIATLMNRSRKQMKSS